MEDSAGPSSSRRITAEEKLEAILEDLRRMNWTVGELLYHLFRTHDKKGQRVRRSNSHGSVVGRFLSGSTTYKPIQIVDFWLQDPAGRTHRKDPEHELMYSPTTPYGTIKHARQALTAMCVQLCEKRMLRERKNAVRGANGLHGSKEGKRGRKELQWDDISSRTVADAREIFRTHQPVTLHILTALARPAPYKNELGEVIERKTRPPELVSALH